MADNGQSNPPDHATNNPTDRPTFLQHRDGADGVAAAATAPENQVMF